MMRFAVAITVLALASGAYAAVVYQDSFETDLSAYTLSGTTTISTEQAHDGLSSLKTVSSGGRARLTTNFAPVTDAISFEYWLYDGGGARGFANVISYTPGSWGAGLQQLFAIGKYNGTDLNLGSGAEAFEATKYQARITSGIVGATAGSWFNLNAPGVPVRSNGWHKFTITTALDYSSVSFYVDDILGRQIALNASGKPAQGFDWVSFGLGAGTTAEVFHYDQASLITIPEPATLALLALGGLALVRRRVA